MQKLRPHINVVQIQGVCTQKSMIIVTEFVALGSLYDFIRTESGKKQIKTCEIDIIKGIAAGMYHLVTEKVIHRDLAARNVLLTKDLIPKISDFGYSRNVQRSDSGSITLSTTGPLKWMAPESILGRFYNEKTDVWSFGVTMWEILTATDPYPELDPIQAGIKVARDNLTLQIPKECPILVKNIMNLCFKYKPDERPTFKEIFSKLSEN